MGKSNIRKSLIECVEDNSADLADTGNTTVPRVEAIFLDGNGDHIDGAATLAFFDPPEDAQAYTVIDGCQLLKSLPFATDSTVQWQQIRYIMNSKIRRFVEMLPGATAIVMFDDRRFSSRAKRPTQNQRRFDPILRELRKYSAENPLKLPQTFEIQDDHCLPNTWSVLSLLPAVSRAFDEYVTAGIDRSIATVYDGTDNVGEFDHYFLRYIIKIMKSCKSPERLAFNLVSSDTDILIYALYALEFIQNEFDLSYADLPSIYVTSPCLTKRTHVTNLYRHLSWSLASSERYMRSTMIRSLCTALIVSGNDNIPQPYGIVPHQFFLAFVRYRRFFGAPIIQYVGADEKGMVRINGAAIIMLHILAYTSKHLLGDKSPINLAMIETMTLDQVYAFVDAQIRKKIKNPRGHLLSISTMRARLQSLILSIYAIEHALTNIPYADRINIQNLSLPYTAFYNFYEKITTAAKSHPNNQHFNLHDYHKCIGYTEDMLPDAKARPEHTMTEVLNLIAERIHFTHVSRVAYVDMTTDDPEICY